jgi:predicted dehydrogenase
MSTSKSEKQIRYAVVGLGYFAQAAVLPAFKHARENSRLTAFVSSDPAKHRKLGKEYGVEGHYSYDQFEDCLKSGTVDAVYIVLPNSLHRDFTVRAANAGVHVLCEKPMAVTEKECEEMIDACEQNNVKLMIAYRLHFEAANLQAIEIANSGKIGNSRFFNSVFSQQVLEGNVRTKKSLGGGTLYDMGVYAINAARYLFREEPISVVAFSANNGEKRFQEIDEMTAAILRFPDERLASFTISFGAADTSAYRIVGTKGSLLMEPAYEYAMPLAYKLTVEGKSKTVKFPKRDQLAAELLYFSDCILKDKRPEPSGTEGLADVRIIRALYQSAETGRSVSLGPFTRSQRPTMRQKITRPATAKPDLVHVQSPSGS